MTSPTASRPPTPCQTPRAKALEATSPDALLARAGLLDLKKDSPLSDVERALRRLAAGLAGADSLRVAVVHVSAVKRLEQIGVRSPSALVTIALSSRQGQSGAGNLQGRAVLFPSVEPWPDPVDGAALLDALFVFFSRFIVAPAVCLRAGALWVVHTWTFEAFDITPRLAVTSPTKRCGKTTLLDILFAVVFRALSAANVTTAAVFRSIEKYHPTLLIDEADTFLAAREELRGVLNAGHRRGGTVIRCVGDDSEARAFDVFTPAAVARIGKLPDTLADRGIPIRLERRLKTQRVERLSLRRVAAEAGDLRRKLRRWAADNLPALRDADPVAPPGLHDRAEDNWRALLAIADAARGSWPRLAREAAVKLSGGEAAPDDSLLGILLSDLKDLFEREGASKIASARICGMLTAIEGRPWAELRRGHEITPNGLARLLAPVGVRPRTVRTGPGPDDTGKGYSFDDLADAFARYGPPSTTVTVSQAPNSGVSGSKGGNHDPSHSPPVTDAGFAPNRPETHVNACCDVVPDHEAPLVEEEAEWMG